MALRKEKEMEKMRELADKHEERKEICSMTA
jgi:hypothetical protein